MTRIAKIDDSIPVLAELTSVLHRYIDAALFTASPVEMRTSPIYHTPIPHVLCVTLHTGRRGHLCVADGDGGNVVSNNFDTETSAIYTRYLTPTRPLPALCSLTKRCSLFTNHRANI